MNIIDAHIPYGGGINVPHKIVVHSMGENIGSQQYTHAVSFLNKYKLSAHILVSPNGDLYRCRYDSEIAWHARGHNTNSLGIEFLVKGNHNYSTFLKAIKTDYITDEQMESGIKIVQEWVDTYDIKDITRHSDLSPDRKLDPGTGFNWDYFIQHVT